MPINVRADDGSIQTFPDDTSPESIHMAMLAYNHPDDWGGLAGKVASAVGQTTGAPAPQPPADDGAPPAPAGADHHGSFWTNPVVDALGKLWSAPNTALGLGAAGLSYGAGLLAGTHPKFQIGDNGLQLLNSSLNIGDRPYTLGNVQIYPQSKGGQYGPQDTPPWNSYTGVPVRNGAHEGGHSQQGQILGPLYLPAEALGSLLGKNNPLEVGADKFGLGRSSSGF